MRTGTAILLYAACALAAQAGGNKVTVSKSANTAVIDTATADACTPTLVEHFSRHSIYQISPYTSGHHALIVQEFDVGTGCFESFSPAKVTVTARSIDARSGRVGTKNLWSFATNGVNGEVEKGNNRGLYRVDMPGCCGSNKTSKYFSLDTGKLVGSSTGRLLEITFVDRDESHRAARRFISVEDNTASSSQASAKTMATIFYADGQSVKEVVSVAGEGKIGTEGWWISELSFIGQDLSAESLALSGSATGKLHILLQCRCDAKPVDVTLPFSIDGLDEKAAIIEGPKGIALTKSTHNLALKRGGAITRRPLTPR